MTPFDDIGIKLDVSGYDDPIGCDDPISGADHNGPLPSGFVSLEPGSSYELTADGIVERDESEE